MRKWSSRRFTLQMTGILTIPVLLTLSTRLSGQEKTDTPRPAAPTSAPSSARAPRIQQLAFAATSIKGESIVFPNDYAGKLVFVMVWGSWCPVCAREIAYWKAAEERFRGQNVEFLGIATDRNRQITVERVEAAIRRHQLSWSQIYEEGAALADQLDVASLPFSMLVDGDTGNVIMDGSTLRKKRLLPRMEQAFTQKFGHPPADSQPASQPTKP